MNTSLRLYTRSWMLLGIAMLLAAATLFGPVAAPSLSMQESPAPTMDKLAEGEHIPGFG
jgi:hypothetical protein